MQKHKTRAAALGGTLSCAVLATLAAPVARGELVGQWLGDSFTEEADWIDEQNGIVATINNSPTVAPETFNGRQAVDFFSSDTDYFSIDGPSNPLTGATELSLVAVFEPLAVGAGGGEFFAVTGLIGMELPGDVPDWGLGYNNDEQVVGGLGVGNPDTDLTSGTTTIPPQSGLRVAMLTWNDSGEMRLFVNGLEVASTTSASTTARIEGSVGLGAITGGGGNPFDGYITELRMYDSDESANAETIADDLRTTYFAEPTLISSSLNRTGGTLVLQDGAQEIDGSGDFEVILDQTTIPDTDVTVSKTGSTTTVEFDAEIGPLQQLYAVDVVAPVVGGDTVTFLTELTSYTLPDSLATPAPSLGTWGIREYTGTGAADLIAATTVADEATATFVEDTAPVFNHGDPDTQGLGNSGNFNNDLPILSNTDEDDDFVVVGTTQIDVPAPGQYTFAVHSDDGFAMRVSGAGGGRFVSANGLGDIDPADDQTIQFDGGTGDVNTHGVYEFDAAGTYDILYVGWDGGGGGYYELSWAPGAFTGDMDTNTWELIGSPDDPAVPDLQDRWINDLPGPAGTAGNFGIRTYRQAGDTGNLGAVNNFLENLADTHDEALITDAQAPYLNHADPQDGGRGFFDSELPFPGNTPANDDNVITVAKGRISIPSDGAYTFSYQGDDGYLLRLKGVGANPDPAFKQATNQAEFEMANLNELFWTPGGTFNGRGIVDLLAGEYDIEFVHFEGGGAFDFELTAAAGEWPDPTLPPEGFKLIGFSDAGQSVTVPAIAEPGWTVESSTSQPGTENSLAGAQTRVNTTLADDGAPEDKVTIWDEINFTDPEVGSEFTFSPSNAWPLDTPEDDNDYAIRVRGTLEITEAGTYYLGYQSDDGASMFIRGLNGDPDPEFTRIAQTALPNVAVVGEEIVGSGVNNAIKTDTPTGNSYTVGAVDLEVGEYEIESIFFEGGGGSGYEVIGSSAIDVPNFDIPLLALGGAGTVVPDIENGLSLLEQPVVNPPDDGDFAISSFAITGDPVGSASFSFSSEDGASYTVEASVDLVNWSTLTTETGTGTSTDVEIDLTAFPEFDGQDKVFFRVMDDQ